MAMAVKRCLCFGGHTKKKKLGKNRKQLLKVINEIYLKNEAFHDK